MCIWISVCCHIISSVNEIVPCLCCHNRVQHHRKVTARRVFHTDRNIHSTRCQSVLLVFHGAGANCFIRENIVQVASVFRIEHLIGTCKTIVLNNTEMHLADCDDPSIKIRRFIRDRLMEHSFIPLPCCTRFICVNTRNDHQFIFHLLIHSRKATYILTHCIFIVRRTRTDQYDEFIRFSCKNRFDLLIPFFF